MHILYFHQHFSTPDGSAGTRSYEMARQLVQEGHSVTMVCGSYAGGKTGVGDPFARGRRRGMVDGIDVIEFDLSYGNDLGFVRRAMVFMRFALMSVVLAMRLRYDLLFATSTPLTVGIPGILARWLRGKTFVFEVRDLWPELPRAMGVITNPLVLAAMSLLEWASYRSAHRCVALAPGIADGIARRGVPADRIEMIPNGCDIDLFKPAAVLGEPVPLIEDLPNDRLVAVYCGTHGIANGLDSVIEAAAELKRRGRDDIMLLLIGNGREKPRLMRRAEEQKLDNIRFVNPVSKMALSAVLARADVGLQILQNVPAFYYGTSPNKFFDYLSAGLPVLCNYPGWVANILESEQCGFPVAPEAPAAFADALVTAAADPALLVRFGRNARRIAEGELARPTLAKRWTRWITSANTGEQLESVRLSSSGTVGQ